MIDRSYVEKFFPPRIVCSYDPYRNPIYGKNNNYMILTKDPELKEHWERKLATSIPDDVELWEKLHPHEEEYRY